MYGNSFSLPQTEYMIRRMDDIFLLFCTVTSEFESKILIKGLVKLMQPRKNMEIVIVCRINVEFMVS